MDHTNLLKPGCVIVIPWEPNYGGGVNEVVLNLYRETLLAGEMQPMILVNTWAALRPIERLRDGRRTVYLRLSSPSGSIIGLVKWILMSPVFLTNLLRFCRRYRVVAFNFQFSSLSAFPIALLRFLRLYRGGLILTFQGLDLSHARGAGRIERMLWRLVLRCTTAVVACSRSLAEEVAEFTGNMSNKVRAIHNGVNIDYLISNVDRQAKLPTGLGDGNFILSVATYEDKKGLDVLLRAFARVRPQNAGLALVLVGMPAGAEASLRGLSAELGVAKDVFFCSNVPHTQVGLFLERAKVFCLPSRVEPFGIAILEAGAYRLPVVASRVGGIPEIVIDGETGLLFEREDVGGLARALNRVLFDTQLARGLGERLYERVTNNFSARCAYEQYRSLLPHVGLPRG